MKRKTKPIPKEGTLLSFFKAKSKQQPQSQKPKVHDLTDCDEDDPLLAKSPKTSTQIHTNNKGNSVSNSDSNGLVIPVRNRPNPVNSSINSFTKTASPNVYDEYPNTYSDFDNNNETEDSSSQSSSVISSQTDTVLSMTSSTRYRMNGILPVKRSRPSFSTQANIIDYSQAPQVIDLDSPPTSFVPNTSTKRKQQPIVRDTVKRPAYGSNKIIDLTTNTSASQPSYHLEEDIVYSSPTSESRSLPSSFQSASSLLSSPTSPSIAPSSAFSSSPYTVKRLSMSNSSISSRKTAKNYGISNEPTYVPSNPLGSSRFAYSSASIEVAASKKTPSTRYESPFNKSSTYQSPSKNSSLYPTKRFPKPKKTASASQLAPSSSHRSEYRPNLSAEQQRILDMVVNQRQSLFFTGSAGTGKSVLMRALIDTLRDKYGTGVAVTASTGIAACNINGCTLHSFAGIGMGTDEVTKLIRTIEGKKQSRERWRKTTVLIIDEISMVDASLFDKLEKIARYFKMPSEPFGGIQLIVTGDFFQLPPVKATGFAFEAKSWPQVMKQTVVLTHVFRQKDQIFVDVLNEMRVGKLSYRAIELFESLKRPLPESNIKPAELYPLRWQVEQSNNARLQALPGEVHEFHASDSGIDRKKIESCIAPSLIRLKKDAQVMLLKNMDATLVNGSLGIVIGFVGEGKFKSAKSVKSRLAPNKREGQITDRDIDEVMSRPYPVVRFGDGREIVIEDDRWSMELPDGQELAARVQIPLILAWAMSIHKSQGQTLERVRVDLGASFEDGMAYVALSRATSLQSLQIINFNASKVTASPKVAKFYKTLQSL